MLSNPQPKHQHVRQQSLRQEYEEFLLQQIEEYKGQLSRPDLLAIADEAVRELEVSPREQLVLTEVLVLEHVDRLIMRRLKLPSFRKWKDRHLKRRQAQRGPKHWGLDRQSPLVDLALRLDNKDMALAVGGGTAPAAYFLAAHDWPTLLIDRDLTTVESVETRVAAEGLAQRFQAMVVNLGNWFPDVAPTLVVIDVSTLNKLDPPTRGRVIDTFKRLTSSGGVHYILPTARYDDILPLSYEVLRAHYSDWGLGDPGRRPLVGFTATKP
jgi:hypothetical protein